MSDPQSNGEGDVNEYEDYDPEQDDADYPPGMPGSSN